MHAKLYVWFTQLRLRIGTLRPRKESGMWVHTDIKHLSYGFTFPSRPYLMLNVGKYIFALS